MKWVCLTLLVVALTGCEKPQTLETITQEHAYKLIKKISSMEDKRLGPPQDIPFHTGPPKPDVAKVAALSVKVTQLQVTVITKGSGPIAKDGDFLTVYYRGELPDGFVFDANAKAGGTPFTFQLGKGKVIKGWDLAIKGMRVGETRKIVIPSNLAYGSVSPGANIPANSALTFYVNLTFVGNTP